MWIVSIILSVAVILFVTEWIRVDLVALGVILALVLTGTLSASEALAGFSNSAVLTIGFLFVVGGAIWQTGSAATIGRGILEVAGTKFTRLLVVLVVAVAFMSSFMSNTGTVAVLLPAVIILAKQTNIAPAKLLIPLSFGSMFGGAATLIGTPPNLVISNVMVKAGLEPFGFFSFLPMGLVLVVLGTTYMLTVGQHLLPDRTLHDPNRVEGESPHELVKRYQLPNNLHRLRVLPDSALVGMTLAETHLIAISTFLCCAFSRPAASSGPAAVMNLAHNRQSGRRPRDTPIIIQKETQVHAGDALIVEGERLQVEAAARARGLAVEEAKAKDAKALVGKDTGVAEVVIPPSSRLIGKTLAEARFGEIHRLWVLGIRRPGNDEELDDKTTKLQFGDVLLVQGIWENILRLRDNKRDFVLVGEPETGMGPPRRRRAGWALTILAAMIGVMMWGVLPAVIVTLMAAVAMVLTGCLSMDGAYDAVDWKSIVLIAGMLPMSTAMENVGLVNVVADGLVQWLGGYDPRAVMAGLFVLTAIFTQIISNTATTVVVAPIALVAAVVAGDPTTCVYDDGGHCGLCSFCHARGLAHEYTGHGRRELPILRLCESWHSADFSCAHRVDYHSANLLPILGES